MFYGQAGLARFPPFSAVGSALLLLQLLFLLSVAGNILLPYFVEVKSNLYCVVLYNSRGDYERFIIMVLFKVYATNKLLSFRVHCNMLILQSAPLCVSPKIYFWDDLNLLCALRSHFNHNLLPLGRILGFRMTRGIVRRSSTGS